MKLTNEALKKIIMEELESIVAEQETGSFFRTDGGAKFQDLLGIQGMMDLLEQSSNNINRIKDAATQAQSATTINDEVGSVGDSKTYDILQNMIDRCNALLSELDYQKFLK